MQKGQVKSMEELQMAVAVWAEQKGIIKHSTPLKQHIKTQEEVTELLQALVDGNDHDIKDAIGDIVVTLIIQAYLVSYYHLKIEKIKTLTTMAIQILQTSIFTKEEKQYLKQQVKV
jgi:NTP pyrophosphatase (non-canonical NTP hydrolase)